MRYKVKPGFRFGNRKQYGEGDIVHLSEQEAAGFLDKLEPVPDAPTMLIVNPAPFPAPAPAPILVPDAWAHIDFGDLSKSLHMISLLVEAGFTTPDHVRGANDDELLAIKGIGGKSLAVLRSVLGVG